MTQLVLSRFGSRRVMMAGLGLFLAALPLIVVALAAASMTLFLAGTVVGGVATLFTGDFPAMLAYSILLAALSLFSLTSIRRAL